MSAKIINLSAKIFLSQESLKTSLIQGGFTQKMSSLNSARTASFVRQSQQSVIEIDDISVTSDIEDEPNINFCEGQLFNYRPQTLMLDPDLYPQFFYHYPKQLVKALNDFTKPFSHHKITKLLNYEANMSFLIAQIGFSLGKLPKQYLENKKIQAQLKLFEFYLAVHAMSNTSQLYLMIWILLGEKQMSYNWPAERKKIFINLKTYKGHLIDKSKGIQLTKKINLYHLACINRCIKLKYQQESVPYDLDQMIFQIFKNNSKEPFKTRTNLIHKDASLDQIRKHFDDKELQQLLISITRDYFKALYKQVFKFDQVNEKIKDKTIIELLYMILVAQLHSEDFPFWILKYIENEKMNILNNQSKILSLKSYPNLIFQSNLYLRIILPKFYFLMKRNGFMKMLSLLHESDDKNIAKQIAWNVSLFTKTSNNKK